MLVWWRSASRANHPPHPERQRVVKIGRFAPVVKLQTPECVYIWDFQPKVAWRVLVVEHAALAAIRSHFTCLVLLRRCAWKGSALHLGILSLSLVELGHVVLLT